MLENLSSQFQSVIANTILKDDNLCQEKINYHDWRAGASQPSPSAGTIFLYIYLPVATDRCRSTVYPSGPIRTFLIFRLACHMP